MHDEIILKRDVEAIQIPSGDTVNLTAGMAVFITQKLGGTYTVATQQGSPAFPPATPTPWA